MWHSHSVTVTQISIPKLSHIDQRLLIRNKIFIPNVVCTVISHEVLMLRLVESGSLDLHFIDFINED